jgi:toxin ParE1/3/4
MTQVYVLPQAWTEVFMAVDWYDSHSPGLGAELMQAVHFALDKIRDNPLQFPIVETSIRRARTSKFPFGVFFSMEHGIAVVFAIENLQRSPARWKRRKQG